MHSVGATISIFYRPSGESPNQPPYPLCTLIGLSNFHSSELTHEIYLKTPSSGPALVTGVTAKIQAVIALQDNFKSVFAHMRHANELSTRRNARCELVNTYLWQSWTYREYVGEINNYLGGKLFLQ